MIKLDLEKTLKQAQSWAEALAEIQGSYAKKIYLSKKFDVLSKGDDGLATEADVKCEKKIISLINKTYPKHEILSEEESFFSKQSIEDFTDISVPLWLIDPIDGTNNFLSGLPFYCTSIALFHKKQVVLGLIHNPVTNETFYAIKGKGAYWSKKFGRQVIKKKITLKQHCPKPFGEALISTNLGSKRHNAELIRKFPQVRAFRRLGSAALELAYVAANVLDGYWEYSLKPWDVAAGGMIGLEAGCRVTDLHGKEFNPFNSSILMAKSPLYEQLLSVVSD